MQHTLVTSSSSRCTAPFTQAGRNSHRPPFAYCQLYSSQACQSPIRQPQQQQQQQTPATKQQHHDVPAPASAVAAAAAAAAVLLCWQAPAAQALPDTQLQQIKQTIDQDFQQGQYYVTGNLSKDLYAPDCRFKDPTTDVKGVEPYTIAVAALFDPAVSKADLISSEVTGPNSITLKWRLEGKLKIGNLAIKPYTGTTVYTIDEESGKITGHTETWDISAVDAFVSTLLPGFGAPPAPPVTK